MGHQFKLTPQKSFALEVAVKLITEVIKIKILLDVEDGVIEAVIFVVTSVVEVIVARPALAVTT